MNKLVILLFSSVYIGIGLMLQLHTSSGGVDLLGL